MKRKTLKLVACAAVTALMLSMTACGGSDDSKTADTAEVEETVEEETEPEAEAEADVEEAEAEVEEAEEEIESASTGEYTTLEDYYNDPSVKSLLDNMVASMGEDGMSAALEVKGNEFTIIIKIEDSSMIVDGFGELLQSELEKEEYAEQFKEQVVSFDEVVGEAGACTVVMRYTDPDDNVLAEKAFTAN